MYRTALNLLSVAFLLFLGLQARAQPDFCPPNLDFEKGNLASWQFYTGTCCPINTPTLSGPVATRHDLTTGTALDPFGNFPIVAPGGGVYSLKLGNSGTGAQAERARYYVQVPSGTGKHILIYRYAVVFQNPNHNAADQPRFEVSAYDSATNVQIGCNQHTYVSSSSLPGFLLSPAGGSVFYKPWTTSTIDLTGYNGSTVAIDFASGDCDLGGHFGYGYVDMNCGLFQIFGAKCDSSGNITLNGPPGFQSYKWMDSALVTTYGLTQTISITTPTTPTKYAVIVTPYAGFGCPDTIYTAYSIVYDNMQATASPDTAKCGAEPLQLNLSSTNPNGPFSYSWWPATGLSCPTCNNPFTSVATTTTYFNYVENKYGCRDTNKIVVTVKPVPNVNAGNDTTYCDTTSVILKGSGTGGTFYTWFPAASIANPGQPVTTAAPPPNANTTYSLVLFNPATGCSDTDKVVIKTNVVTANAGLDADVCQGSVTKLFAAGGYLYNWAPAAGLSSPTVQSPSFIANSTTMFTLVATSVFGCKDTDQVLITVKPTPIANAGADTSVCQGSAVSLNGSGGTIYKWIPVTGLNNPTIANPTATVKANMNYKLILSLNGCNDTDDVNIFAYPLPTANAGDDTVVCAGIFQLQGSGGINYKWFPSDGLLDSAIQNPFTILKDSITYFLQVTDSNGCTDTDTISLTMIPPPIFNVGYDTTICRGDTVQIFASGGDAYHWLVEDGISDIESATTRVWPTDTRIHKVEITDDLCHIADTLGVKITVNPINQLRVIATPVVCGSEIGQLTAYGGKGYKWNPTDFLSDPEGAITKANPRTSTRYIVTAINAYGCRDTASALLEVYGDDAMFAPDAFTPNNDGRNDCFRVLVTGNITTFEMYIFNRWGQPVFETKNYNDCWDGTYKGRQLDVGTYYYFYKATSPLCGDIIKKGDIQLIK